VTFVNRDIFAHRIGSACPEIDEVGLLQPGESRDTGTFGGARTCSYNDRLNPDQPLLKGTIIVR
jgi:hypothetical protein